MTDRRSFVHAGALALLGVPLRADAQRTAMPRIGFLSAFGPNTQEQAFWQGMRDLGYVDGKNIVADRRSAAGDFARLPGACSGDRQESAGRHCHDRLGGRARRKAGHVDHTNRDGRCVRSRGVRLGSAISPVPAATSPGPPANRTLRSARRSSLSASCCPNASRVAALWNPANGIFQQLLLSEALAAAARLHMLLRLIEVRTREELDHTFATLQTERPDAVLLMQDPMFGADAERVSELALRRACRCSAVREF